MSSEVYSDDVIKKQLAKVKEAGINEDTKSYGIAELMLKGEKDYAKLAKIAGVQVQSVRNVASKLRGLGLLDKDGGRVSSDDGARVSSDDVIEQSTVIDDASSKHHPVIPPMISSSVLPPLTPSVPKGKGLIKPDVQDRVPYLEAFNALETGASPSDIMTELSLDPDTMLMLMKKFNEIRVEHLRRNMIEARYVPLWYEIAQTMGSSVRDGCMSYVDESGACMYWDLQDIDVGLRNKFPGVFKVAGNRMRLRVLEHPELCALCNRAAAFKVVQPAQ